MCVCTSLIRRALLGCFYIVACTGLLSKCSIPPTYLVRYKCYVQKNTPKGIYKHAPCTYCGCRATTPFFLRCHRTPSPSRRTPAPPIARPRRLTRNPHPLNRVDSTLNGRHDAKPRTDRIAGGSCRAIFCGTFLTCCRYASRKHVRVEIRSMFVGAV